MKKSSFVLLLFFCSVVVSAQQLYVAITDSELDIPLEGVQLTLTATSNTSGIIPAQVIEFTDEGGVALIQIGAGFNRGTLLAQLPGYVPVRTIIQAGQQKLIFTMSIEDVIEGKELVVETAAVGKTDAKAGVSVVMDKKEMDTTANIGVVEDIMSSIKTLPGMGFSGSWNAQPSIRGGYPNEMGTVLDDVYILQPFHWGGAFSIFNPNMVKSAKMSHGIFSARYGRAMSGLLEVTTVDPNPDMVRVDASLSTSAVDIFTQIPFTKKAGLFIGGKVTYMETLQILNDDILRQEPKLKDTITQMPFIRDFYAKSYFTPNTALSITLNGFVGTDGIGIHDDTTNDDMRTVSTFKWFNLLGFGAANVKWMPSDKMAIRFLGAYNNNTADFNFKSKTSGTKAYSSEFIEDYSTLIGSDTSYTLKDFGFTMFSRQTIHQYQGKLEGDYLLTKSNILTLGAEDVFMYFTSKAEMNGPIIIPGYPTSEYVDLTYTNNLSGNRANNAALFALISFGTDQSKLRGELGLRAEHFYIWNNNFSLNTYPVVNPRLNLSWTPLSRGNFFDEVTFSLGSGIFSMFPLDAIAADKDMGIKNFSVGPDRALFNVLGTELTMKDGWLFRIEGYYKYYFDRLYITEKRNLSTSKFEVDAHTDGYGYATGFDFMLQKKNGRKFDGYLTYSFVMAQYKNPASAIGDIDTTLMGEPLDRWYYPSFHRFHSLNLILNWKPISALTFTVKTSVASGAPKTKNGAIKREAIKYEDEYIERYTQEQLYNSSLRNELSCPVDLRISYSNYYKNSKVRWEYYVAVENVFVKIYSPKTNPGFDPYTGKEVANSNEADFSLGIPSPSFGYKISY